MINLALTVAAIIFLGYIALFVLAIIIAILKPSPLTREQSLEAHMVEYRRLHPPGWAIPKKLEKSNAIQ